jgi:glycosyltransferase involved in cell wall biosynthesis
VKYAAPNGGEQQRKTCIVFLVRSLDVGGTERQLVVLARGLSQRGHAVTVITYYDGGVLAQGLANERLTVVSLAKRGRWDLWAPFRRLVRELRERQPDIIHGFLPDGNIVTLLARRWVPGAAVVWGVRTSEIDLSKYDWVTRLMLRLSYLLAGGADLIIVNSRAGAASAIANGCPPDRVRVIPNGIDLTQFQPDPEAGARLRAEWGITGAGPVIGIVARLDPLKDHPTFLRAAALFLEGHPEARFVSVGGGPAIYAAELRLLAVQLGIGERILWLESRLDVVPLYSALDLLASTSITEGFSNVVAEAMSCGVTCVVTDVGDSAWVVGDTGLVVPPRDPAALAAAWNSALILRRDGHLAPSRTRIEQHFSLPQLIGRTEEELTRWLRPGQTEPQP